MKPEAQSQLVQLVKRYGTDVIANTQQCKALIYDYLGTNRLEANILVVSLKENIPHKLAAPTSTATPIQVQLNRLAKQLENNQGIAWCEAFGIISTHEVAASKESSTPQQQEKIKSPSYRSTKSTLPGKVLVFTSGQGYVGKTTLVANIGAGLASTGKTVCLVDADTGFRCLDTMLGLEREARIGYGLAEVIEDTCQATKALVQDKRLKNLHLLPSSQVHVLDDNTVEKMRGLCARLAEAFEFVLIDSPAGVEYGFLNSIAGADEVVVVATPYEGLVNDANRVIKMLKANGIHQPQIIVNRIKRTRAFQRNELDIGRIKEKTTNKVLGLVPEDQGVITSTRLGEPVILSGKTRAGEAYANIVRRLLGDTVPFIEL